MSCSGRSPHRVATAPATGDLQPPGPRTLSPVPGLPGFEHRSPSRVRPKRTLSILLIFTLHSSFIVDLAPISGRCLIKEAETGRGQGSAHGPRRGLVPAQTQRPGLPSSGCPPPPPPALPLGARPGQLRAALGNRSPQLGLNSPARRPFCWYAVFGSHKAHVPQCLKSTVAHQDKLALSSLSDRHGL